MLILLAYRHLPKRHIWWFYGPINVFSKLNMSVERTKLGGWQCLFWTNLWMCKSHFQPSKSMHLYFVFWFSPSDCRHLGFWSINIFLCFTIMISWRWDKVILIILFKWVDFLFDIKNSTCNLFNVPFVEGPRKPAW